MTPVNSAISPLRARYSRLRRNFHPQLARALTEVYRRDVNLGIQISYLRLWDDPSDPWDASDAGGQLTQFRNHWLAQMTGLGLGACLAEVARSTRFAAQPTPVTIRIPVVARRLSGAAP